MKIANIVLSLAFAFAAVAKADNIVEPPVAVQPPIVAPTPFGQTEPTAVPNPTPASQSMAPNASPANQSQISDASTSDDALDTGPTMVHDAKGDISLWKDSQREIELVNVRESDHTLTPSKALELRAEIRSIRAHYGLHRASQESSLTPATRRRLNRKLEIENHKIHQSDIHS
jgi:hypothetical protein